MSTPTKKLTGVPRDTFHYLKDPANNNNDVIFKTNLNGSPIKLSNLDILSGHTENNRELQKFINDLETGSNSRENIARDEGKGVLYYITKDEYKKIKVANPTITSIKHLEFEGSNTISKVKFGKLGYLFASSDYRTEIVNKSNPKSNTDYTIIDVTQPTPTLDVTQTKAISDFANKLNEKITELANNIPRCVKEYNDFCSSPTDDKKITVEQSYKALVELHATCEYLKNQYEDIKKDLNTKTIDVSGFIKIGTINALPTTLQPTCPAPGSPPPPPPPPLGASTLSLDEKTAFINWYWFYIMKKQYYYAHSDEKKNKDKKFVNSAKTEIEAIESTTVEALKAINKPITNPDLTYVIDNLLLTEPKYPKDTILVNLNLQITDFDGQYKNETKYFDGIDLAYRQIYFSFNKASTGTKVKDTNKAAKQKTFIEAIVALLFYLEDNNQSNLQNYLGKKKNFIENNNAQTIINNMIISVLNLNKPDVYIGLLLMSRIFDFDQTLIYDEIGKNNQGSLNTQIKTKLTGEFNELSQEKTILQNESSKSDKLYTTFKDKLNFDNINTSESSKKDKLSDYLKDAKLEKLGRFENYAINALMLVKNKLFTYVKTVRT